MGHGSIGLLQARFFGGWREEKTIAHCTVRFKWHVKIRDCFERRSEHDPGKPEFQRGFENGYTSTVLKVNLTCNRIPVRTIFSPVP